MQFSRRALQTILGIIWIVDGILQFKPQMFTKAFLEQVVLPTAQGQPGWIGDSVTWAAHMALPHIGLYNAVFAMVQLLLGIGLAFNIRTKTTLVASFVWTAVVWWFGEGFGQVLTGQSLMLTGAPGGVLVYGLIGWAIWPTKEPFHFNHRSNRAQTISPSGRNVARWSLGLSFLLGAALQLQPAYLTANGIGGAFSVSWLANLVGNHGITTSLVLLIVQLVVGVGILTNRPTVSFAWAAIIVSFLFWWVGQDFGQMFTPLGTDPNSGPLFILLALCAYPELLTGRTVGLTKRSSAYRRNHVSTSTSH